MLSRPEIAPGTGRNTEGVPGRQSCRDNCPPEWVGHWRDWHRGHGCDKDPGPINLRVFTVDGVRVRPENEPLLDLMAAALPRLESLDRHLGHPEGQDTLLTAQFRRVLKDSGRLA